MSEICSKTQEQGILFYGDKVINYDIIRLAAISNAEQAKRRKVIIKVHPDQRVVAAVPHDASTDVIQEAMLKRAKWVWASINEFSSQNEYVMPRQYVSGEAQFYLGRRYVLKVIIDPDQTSNVKLHRGKLTVNFKKDCDDRVVKIKALLDKWYTHRANLI